MQKLTLKDVSLALNDLMTTRLDAFKTTRTYLLYEPNLKEKLTAVNGLPAAIIEDRPFAVELADTDGRHDGLGGAIFQLLDAIARHPTLSPKVKAAARRIQQQFVRRLAVLRESYANEADAAKRNRAVLASFETDLKSIPTPDNATLYDWVVAFLDEGDNLNKVLSDRATVKASVVAEAAALRASTIGLIGRVRTALDDEVSSTPSLARNLDALLFGYFEILNKFREEQGAAAEPPPAVKPPPPAEPPPAAESGDK